jgi:hypothetical protein
MWLSKDERRLLAGYYSLIGEVSTERVYRSGDLRPLLRFRGHSSSVREYGDAAGSAEKSNESESSKHGFDKYIDDLAASKEPTIYLLPAD